jgi:hypothetical protein
MIGWSGNCNSDRGWTIGAIFDGRNVELCFVQHELGIYSYLLNHWLRFTS